MLACIISLFLVVYEIGFDAAHNAHIINYFTRVSHIIFLSGIGLYLLIKWREARSRLYMTGCIALGVLTFFSLTGSYRLLPESATASYWHLAYVIFIVFLSLSVLSQLLLSTSIRKIKPQLLFVYSFLLIIFLGALLLLLPNATHRPISILEAFFTSTSAVCVTGLSVLDVSATFTLTGQLILMLLIQVGGIGVMTFTCFFALSSAQGVFFQNQQLYRDLTSEENASLILKTLYNIIGFSLLIEMAGAYIVYMQIAAVAEAAIPNKVVFSLFHAVSSFCNAGFSTLQGNLYDPVVRVNYGLHTTVALLVVIGGLGFPIIFNTGKLLRHYATNSVRQVLGLQRRYTHRPRIINTTSRIVLWSTLALLVLGTLLFWWLEKDNTLKGLGFWGQLSGAFFGAVTPRTAGFNSIDLGRMLPATILLTIFLMWIGASPMSTGGGIKTTVFAIALKNCWNMIRQRRRLEINRREIMPETINRAFAIITLSLVWVAVASMIIIANETQVRWLDVIFEVFSALGTVGLSLNLTPGLSSASQVVLIVTMFVGRVGIITVLTGVVKQYQHNKYSYPTDTIIL